MCCGAVELCTEVMPIQTFAKVKQQQDSLQQVSILSCFYDKTKLTVHKLSQDSFVSTIYLNAFIIDVNLIDKDCCNPFVPGRTFLF